MARACIIESELKNARDDIARIEGAFTGDVRVCVSPTTAINMVPKALINLKRRRPEINVKIEENVYPDNLARPETRRCGRGRLHASGKV